MRQRKIIILVGMALGLGPVAMAADPVTYQVKFLPSGDAELDGLLTQTASLLAMQKKLPAAPFALIGRAQADQQQFYTVLHSLGYDDGLVDVTIDGEALTDPTLLDRLTQAPKGQVVTVLITPHRGPLFRLGRVRLDGLPKHFSAPLTIAPGQPARAAPILAASATLQTALHNAGYAFAKVSPPYAVAALAAHQLNVTYTVTPGQRVKIGNISFVGLKRTDAAFLRRHIALRPGQEFSDSAVEDARNALLSLGIFSAVTPQPQPHPVDGAIPIVFDTTPQKRHAVTVSLAYATDVGFTLSSSWEDRNVFGHAETLTYTAAADGLGGTGSTAPGYDFKGVFAKPDYDARGQTLSVSLEDLDQSLTAYDRTAALAGASLSRPVTAHTAITYGPSFVTEQVTQNGLAQDYVLLQLPVTFSYDTADSVLEPTHGINASLTLTPTEPVEGDKKPFLIAQMSAATYLPVERAARGIIAVRLQAGSIQGATQFQVPADQRFYAGGSGTVRGYTYQTIGPLFANDNPEGGLGFDAVNLEFRQHIGKSFGIVPFVDAGQVNAGSAPFQGTLRIGVGLGARYHTSIGPIRVDVAVPLTRVAGSGSFALYVGLGEAF
jgi:translocation and assembly module TamA